MLRIIYSFLFLLPVTVWGQQSFSAYQQEITAHRAKEDSLFKYGDKSPLTPKDKITFEGLEYFPVNVAYRVKARFVRTAHEGVFKMPTTGPRTPEYMKFAELHFVLQGQPLRLNVYQNQELMKQVQYANYLFLPFTDATTGQETYVTGRYLDFSIPMMGQDSVWLDFNRAYNPSCAYSDGYSCPIPPKENKLPLRIEAGVKTYDKKEKGSAQGEPAPLPTAEVAPEFPGGNGAMMKHIATNFRIPKSVKKARLKGEEVFSFMVEEDGTAGQVKSVRSMHPELFAEAVRVISLMPKWKPGTLQGKPVPVMYTVPLKINAD